jgi:exosortase
MLVATSPHTNEIRSSRMQLWLVAALLALLYAPTVQWLFNRWTLSVWHHAHGLLILAVVVWLVYTDFRDHPDRPVEPSAFGFLWLAPALVLLAVDAGIHSQLLSAVSLVLALPGLAWLLLGRERAQRILAPLLFLFLTLPIPLAFTTQLHLVLRKIATAATAWVVPRLGIPLYSEGTTLHIPAGALQVADACSGFSTLYASVAVACLVAWFCPHNGRRALVLLAAAPIAIAANILRVILLVLLVEWQGLDILGTSLHTISGLFTFAIALPVIFWLGQPPRSPTPA